jgi:hypothetical protein
MNIRPRVAVVKAPGGIVPRPRLAGGTICWRRLELGSVAKRTHESRKWSALTCGPTATRRTGDGRSTDRSRRSREAHRRSGTAARRGNGAPLRGNGCPAQHQADDEVHVPAHVRGHGGAWRGVYGAFSDRGHRGVGSRHAGGWRGGVLRVLAGCHAGFRRLPTADESREDGPRRRRERRPDRQYEAW